MSQFIIQVNGSVYGSFASVSAFHFCQAALAQGHRIHKVFFYQDGVFNANQLTCPASDEPNLHQQWLTLATDHNIALVNCVSAALRRGIVSAQDTTENGLQSVNCAPQFTMGGLGELITGIEKADRLISF
ncbi:sulfurtransferase complex subunit TusD [Shewanella intestini]|uniref:Sulfurtransferase complex subunit TusD n=1 Tax=Shewanella intestini TaxID=2017544 RepID=A0ABS5HZE8_9GAMM|nr:MULTISPECIES: sulfurtransferase complex subunit TusD [Shewanella]MBR9727151.1 sulfurtransferase complex subunit TusD [Shewanella intestini]MRG35953.1 sulfurtransferase complex subunit TusD [Shewanella sp. XMDDZSB0408]